MPGERSDSEVSQEHAGAQESPGNFTDLCAALRTTSRSGRSVRGRGPSGARKAGGASRATGLPLARDHLPAVGSGRCLLSGRRRIGGSVPGGKERRRRDPGERPAGGRAVRRDGASHQQSEDHHHHRRDRLRGPAPRPKFLSRSGKGAAECRARDRGNSQSPPRRHARSAERLERAGCRHAGAGWWSTRGRLLRGPPQRCDGGRDLAGWHSPLPSASWLLDGRCRRRWDFPPSLGMRWSCCWRSCLRLPSTQCSKVCWRFCLPAPGWCSASPLLPSRSPALPRRIGSSS